LELDPGAHTVMRAGREIQLTGKEYAFLEYLMRNQGRIVTETNILEHVWDMQTNPFTNVVSVYIHYLRNKVDKGFDKALIHTVRSIGYTIRDNDAD
jgi:DNA-binding response OmpR family regulator